MVHLGLEGDAFLLALREHGLVLLPGLDDLVADSGVLLVLHLPEAGDLLVDQSLSGGLFLTEPLGLTTLPEIDHGLLLPAVLLDLLLLGHFLLMLRFAHLLELLVGGLGLTEHLQTLLAETLLLLVLLLDRLLRVALDHLALDALFLHALDVLHLHRLMLLVQDLLVDLLLLAKSRELQILLLVVLLQLIGDHVHVARLEHLLEVDLSAIDRNLELPLLETIRDDHLRLEGLHLVRVAENLLVRLPENARLLVELVLSLSRVDSPLFELKISYFAAESVPPQPGTC